MFLFTHSGPACSNNKVVNLVFVKSSSTKQIKCTNIFAEKMRKAFAIFELQKLLTFFLARFYIYLNNYYCIKTSAVGY